MKNDCNSTAELSYMMLEEGYLQTSGNSYNLRESSEKIPSATPEKYCLHLMKMCLTVQA